MDKIKLAIETARQAHTGQFRRDGKPYFTHVEKVFNKTKNVLDGDRFLHKEMKENVLCAAVLHDVLEDTVITAEKLRSLGFSDETIKMVEIISKKKGENYFDFIMRIKRSKNVGAILIKLMDLDHNTSDNPKEGATLDKYRFAEYILNLDYGVAF